MINDPYSFLTIREKELYSRIAKGVLAMTAMVYPELEWIVEDMDDKENEPDFEIPETPYE